MKKFLIPLLLSFACSTNAQTSVSDNVSTFELEAPELGACRTIWIYLPEGYQQTDENYPVLYMHDAQNLFDPETSYAGEWKVDELLDSQKDHKMIVVGIAHGEENRITELTPYSHKEYGGGGAETYLRFLMHTLKPHVDQEYRTLPDRRNTSIMGSSLGGLLSFYALIKYPETFGQAGVFSPSFWFSTKIFDLAREFEPGEDVKIFFLAGKEEGDQMVTDLLKMTEILRNKGMNKTQIRLDVIEEGVHNEAFWSAHFLKAYNWLYPGRTTSSRS